MRDELLALLEERPYRIAELMAMLGLRRTRISDALHILRLEGRVQSDDDKTWSLAGTSGFATYGETKKPEVVKQPRPEVIVRPAVEAHAPASFAEQAFRSVQPRIDEDGEEFTVVWAPHRDAPSLTEPFASGSSLSGEHRLGRASR